MIGRSYNGTLPNAVAATRRRRADDDRPDRRDLLLVRLLADGRDHRRHAHYPAWLANYVTDAPRQPICAPMRAAMNLLDGDADGNMNAFWDERNYRPDADKVKASVFATHCLQDDNVDPDQMTEWWYQLAKHNVPRKLWMCREGHIDPFMINRAEWMRQLHAWFDYWLSASRTGSWTSPASTSRTPRTTGPRTPTGRCPAPPRRRSSCRATRRPRPGRSAASPAGRRTRCAGPTSPTRTRRPR